MSSYFDVHYLSINIFYRAVPSNQTPRTMPFLARKSFVFVAITVALELATAFTSTAKTGLATRHEGLLARKVVVATTTTTTHLFGTVVDLTDDNFSNLVLSSRSNQRLTLVDCYAVSFFLFSAFARARLKNVSDSFR